MVFYNIKTKYRRVDKKLRQDRELKARYKTAIRTMQHVGNDRLLMVLMALNTREKEHKSNFPADILSEDPDLFRAAKELRLPVYSWDDEVVYVWDADNLEEALLLQYALGRSDEDMLPIVTVAEDGSIPKRLNKGEAAWDAHFRKDRRRQWFQAITDALFKAFKVCKEAIKIILFGVLQHVPTLPKERVAVEDIKVNNGLVEVLLKNGHRIVYVFSSEKGKFIPAFRGGREKPVEGEDMEFSSVSMPVLMTEKQFGNPKFKPDLFIML
jgi:hypothetical protein